jgi:hypothetical protein
MFLGEIISTFFIQGEVCVARTITVLFCNSLITKVFLNWDLKPAHALGFKCWKSSEFQLHNWFLTLRGYMAWHYSLVRIDCSHALGFVLRLNFCVECCSRHCNLDPLPRRMHLEGGVNHQITFVRHLLLLVPPPKIYFRNPLYSSLQFIPLAKD